MVRERERERERPDETKLIRFLVVDTATVEQKLAEKVPQFSLIQRLCL